MLVERVHTIEEFRSLGSAWNSVYRCDPEAQFFLSWKWLAGVLETYPGQWMVLVARSADGICLGFLPLRRKTVWSESRQRLRNEIHFAGRMFWADYGGVLCRPDHEEAVLGAFAARLKQMDWSHFYMKGLRMSDRRFGLFMDALADERLLVESRTSIINHGETDNLVCPYIDLPATFEEYLVATLSYRKRQKARNALRKFEASSDFRITATSAATHARDLQIFDRFWRDMWGAVKGADTDRIATKYAMMLKRGLDDGMVHMPILWRGETPVGVLACFIDREKSRLLLFVTGRDEAFRDLPVGLVLHAHNIRWAIENGIRTYDFLRGNEPYKYSLGVTDTRLRYVLVRTKSGTNLHSRLDLDSIGEALRLADEFADGNRKQAAVTACHLVLATFAGQAVAKRLLKALADAP